MNNIKNNIKIDIENVRLLDAIEKMRQVVSSADEINSLILIKGRISENKNQFNIGIKSLEDYNITNTRICLALLELLPKENGFNKSTLYFDFGRARQIEGDFASAKIYFDKVIVENLNMIEAYIERGASLLALENYEDAIQDFSIAIKYQNENPIPYYNRGIAYFQEGKLDLACRDWRKVKELGFDIADQLLLGCQSS